MKKSILISLVTIVLVSFVILSFFVMCKNGGKNPKSTSSVANLSTEQRGEIVKESQLEASKPETSFNGIVGSVTSPKGINVKILEIDGTIDDLEALENMKSSDFVGDSVDIPTMKKTFKVAVDENTKLIGFDSLEDIKSGDQVKVDAGRNPKLVENFTAISVELNFRVQ